MNKISHNLYTTCLFEINVIMFIYDYIKDFVLTTDLKNPHSTKKIEESIGVMSNLTPEIVKG